jgi:hypothetical protein
MRLLQHRQGRMGLVPMSACHCYSAEDIREMLHRLMQESCQLSLDFCGECIPICSTDEISLCASLLSVYHNSNIRENIQVRSI